MAKIVPHLWYDKEAKEAVDFYMSLFDQSKLLHEYVFEDTPSGNADLLTFQLAGQEFQAINGGPYFQFNPSTSLMVACESKEEVDRIWNAMLNSGGTELMPLGEYPFSNYYAWVQDQYGLSWQLMFLDNNEALQKITPCLLFSSDVCGKAEEAIQFYFNVFENGKLEFLNKYQEGEANTEKAVVAYSIFKLHDFYITAMDNGNDVDFTFNEAFSLIVNCQDQQEIDSYWNKLSAVPESEQCGWLKDQYGMSWQIVPDNIDDILNNGPRDEVKRLQKALLDMKKIDIAALERARHE